jgi:PAS domain S-box-containing protein
MEHSEKRTEGLSTDTRNGTSDRAAPSPFKKISSLYAISFLFLVTVVVGFIWHDLRADYRSTLAYWNVQLSSSADDRVRISALWLKERRTDTLSVATNHGVIRLLSAEGSGSIAAEMRQGVERKLAHIAAVNGFLGGAVGDRDCRIAAQFGIRPEMMQGVQQACQWVQRTGEYQVNNFGMEQGKVWLGLSAPVIVERQASSSAPITRRIVGSVVMVTEDWQDLIAILASENAPTKAGETLVVWRKANEAFIFSPRLSVGGVESFFRRPLTGSTFESRVALDGDVAFGEFIDYRGQSVFGVARRIGAPGYSLARKVDRGEALAEHRRRAVLEQLVGALSFLLFGFVMLAQHRNAAAHDFKERVAQQRELRERDRRYRVLFESAGDGIFLMRGSQFMDCNQKALELFGCGREQIIGNTPIAFSPPQQANGSDSQEAALERIRLALEGQTLRFEWQHLRLDGTPFEAEVALNRLEIAGEAHLLALVRDVTERKRVDQALRESEAHFRRFIETVPIGVYRTTPDGRVLMANPALLGMLGYDSWQELASRNLEAEGFEPGYPRSAFRERIEREDEIRGLEAAWKRRDGSVAFVREFARAFRGDDGRVLHYDGVVEDVTERRRAAEALLESQALLDSIVNSTSDLIWSVDAKSLRLLSFNHGFVDFFLQRLGIGAKAGMRPEDLLPTDDLKRQWAEFYQRALREGSFTIEYQMKTAPRTLQLSFNVLKRAGVVFGVSVFAEDITERTRAERELQRSFEQLRALAGRLQSIREEERNRLAREIHDQLGQSLTAIKIGLSSLVHDLPADKRQGSESVLNLIDQTIHSVRRISTELRPLILDDLGLVAAVEWAGEEFEARTRTKCRLDLPPEDVFIDQERATALFRILQETLTNVARHASATRVNIRLTKKEGGLHLEIRDNGKGISEEQLSAGRSLGILGMRERALLLGGELIISGVPGQGTVVSVRIPEARQN